MARLAYMSNYSEFMSHISESPDFHGPIPESIQIKDNAKEVDEDAPNTTMESKTLTETSPPAEQKVPTEHSQDKTDTKGSPENSKGSET